MILTLGELISRSSEMAGGRKDWSVSDVSFYANLAYVEVIGRARFRGMDAMAAQSTITGENRYQLPTDFDYEQSVKMIWSDNTSGSGQSSYAVLMKKNVDQLAAMAAPSVNTGVTTPQFYGVNANEIQIWPTPYSRMSMIMQYKAKPLPLIESSETMLIDDRWHIAVLYKTVAMLEASRGDRDAEALANNRYAQYVSGQPNADALAQQARYGGAASFPPEYFGGWR